MLHALEGGLHSNQAFSRTLPAQDGVVYRAIGHMPLVSRSSNGAPRVDPLVSARMRAVRQKDLKGQAGTPVSLPAIEELTQRVTSLADLLEAEDPERAREVLRRYLRGGQIVLTPEDGVYVARGELFPLQIALGEGGSGNLRCLGVVARGRYPAWTTSFSLGFVKRVA